jgi:hypothetical protein
MKDMFLPRTKENLLAARFFHNFKQKELAEQLLTTVQARYPEIEFINLQRSLEDPNHIWLNVTRPCTKSVKWS